MGSKHARGCCDGALLRTSHASECTLPSQRGLCEQRVGGVRGASRSDAVCGDRRKPLAIGHWHPVVAVALTSRVLRRRVLAGAVALAPFLGTLAFWLGARPHHELCLFKAAGAREQDKQ